VTEERERDTLNGLLALPIERREILLVKWYAAFSSAPWMGYSVATLVGLGVFESMNRFFLFPVTVVFSIGMLLFSCGLGLWLSTRCRTSFRASVWFMLVWLIVLFSPYVLGLGGATIARATGANSHFASEVGTALEAIGPWEVWQTLNPVRDSRPEWSFRDRDDP